MGNLAIRFLICNLFISIIIGFFMAAKWILRKKLTSRMQYHLWLFFLGLLAVPFLPRIAAGRKTPSYLGLLLFILWIAGITGMIVFIIRAAVRFYLVKKSSLPLQNPNVCRLYNACLKEMKLAKSIPIYSTAFLRSPVIAGFIKLCIYMPIHVISDYHAKDLRCMLLHKLLHYKHKDSVINRLINIANILYWFNPFVWYALREKKTDREIACDTSVLNR